MAGDKTDNNDSADQEIEIKVYKKRWLILLLFDLITASNAYQWIQYAIIANIIIRYYNVPSLMVDMTSLIYMITYCFFFIPASNLINKWGLRSSTLIASWGTCIGAWFKVFSSNPNHFYIGFTGQTIVALSQLFSLSVPAKLAAVWFGPEQISTACGLGVMGILIGASASCVVTPLVVENHEDVTKIGADLYRMFIVEAVYTTAVTIAIQIFFSKEPPLPPSKTQAFLRISKISNAEESNFDTFKKLFSNGPFMHLFFAYGCSIGVFNSISTLLNQILLVDFPNEEDFVGQIGLILICAGIISSPMFGYILDKTRNYKWPTLVIYILTAISMITFTFAVKGKSHWNVYICSTLLGLFMSGYFSLGYEVAVELSFPISEANSAALLNAVAQLFGVLFTLLFGWLMPKVGNFWVNVGYCVILGIGTVLTAMTKNIHLRQDNLKKHAEDALKSMKNDIDF